MTLYLGDMNTRARGLGTRLLGPETLERLGRSRSLFALQRELGELGIVRTDAPATARALEGEVRRRAAGLMSILGRWSTDDRKPILAVLLEDEDRRSIQGILRGAEQSASADSRMRGLVPTNTLSERALQVLARQPTIADVVRMLVLWKHPFGHALLQAMTGPRPSLFDLEVALQRAFARRALAHARKAGPDLLAYARQVVDLMNAWSVLLHFPEHEQNIGNAVFIDGGSLLDRETFESLMNESSFDRARDGLARAFEGSPLSGALSADRELATMEGAVLRAQIEQQRQAARLRPAGAAPLVLFTLELRAEVIDLRRIIWGVVLETPTALLQSNMVAS